MYLFGTSQSTIIGIAGSFSEGGQRPTILSSQNSIISCQHFFLFYAKLLCYVLSYSAKLFCQWANMVGERLQNSQKWKKNGKIWQKPLVLQPKMAENRQKWQKALKNVEFYKLSSAKLSFLSCQTPISVLPSNHFCPAKLPILSCQASLSVLPS